MMTKDEAKELTKFDCWAIIRESDRLATNDSIIQQNWPQISNQLDIWFTDDFSGLWWISQDIQDDPIGWMLRAYVGAQQNG